MQTSMLRCILKKAVFQISSESGPLEIKFDL